MKKLNYQGKINVDYYTKNEMKEMYPDGLYEVIGEMSEKKGSNRSMPVYDEEGNVIYVQPTGTYGAFYKNDGYAWNEQEQAFIKIKKKNYMPYIGILVTFSVVVVAIIFFATQFLNKPEVDANAIAFESDIERNEDMDESRILIPGYNDWNMIAGEDEVYIPLYNPDNNPCYFKFTVILDETQEELFQTSLIPPSQAVTTVKLPKTFDEGTYPITVKVTCYSINDSKQEVQVEEIKTNIVAFKAE